MSDLIRRSDAIEAIFKVGHEHVEEKVIPLGAVTDYSDAINSLPSAEARPTGEWIDIDSYYRMATCSHCLKVTMFEKWGEHTRPYGFCPNCGARMKGADDE